MDKEKLILFIKKAFDDVPQPEELTLFVAESHDLYDKPKGTDFIGPWQEIPDEHIQMCTTALSYMDNVGMRFYLPAYMVWFLKHVHSKNTRSLSFDHTLYSLDPHIEDTRLAESRAQQFSLFDQKQKKSCALFVKFCAECNDQNVDSEFAKEIYDKYWYKYNV